MNHDPDPSLYAISIGDRIPYDRETVEGFLRFLISQRTIDTIVPTDWYQAELVWVG